MNVASGLFTVGLDFGTGIFTGDALWLEIEVRVPHDPSNTAPYTTLSPRQELTPTPYALYAATAGGTGWKDDGTVVRLETSADRVGIGTTDPATTVHMDGQSLWLTGGDGAGLAASAGAGMRMYFCDTNDAGHIWAYDYGTGVRKPIALQPTDGDVGIGTSSPGAKLDVNGVVRATRFEDRDDPTWFVDPASTGKAAAFAGRVGVRGQPFWSAPFGGPDLHVRAANPTDTAVVYIGDECSSPGDIVGYLGFTGQVGGSLIPPYGPFAGIRGEIVQTGNDARGRMVFTTREPLTIPSPPPDMCIESNGFVGIRVDSAQARLHIGGVAGVDGIMFPDGSLQTTAAGGGGGSAWLLAGNGGTSPGSDFLGTTDNQALQLHVNNNRALRIEPTEGSPNLIGGYVSNNVYGGVVGATISGGGTSNASNHVGGNYGTVGGGQRNSANGENATVGGGNYNNAYGQTSTIAGGYFNTTQLNSSTVGGGSSNIATSSGATVSGGSSNQATGQYGAVGGGYGNQAMNNSTTIGGGSNNVADGEGATVSGGLDNVANNAGYSLDWCATVGGGRQNHAEGGYCTVAGGRENHAHRNNGYYATIGGGYNNVASGSGTVAGGYGNNASGFYSAIPGGSSNEALGENSFAAGEQAKALDEGCFVWSDRSGGAFPSTGPNQFLVRADGGVGINTNNPSGFALAVNGTAAKPGGGTWANFSDRRLKKNIEPLGEALRQLLELRGVTFEYKQPESRFGLPGRQIGLIAQEVERVFPDWVDEDADGYKYVSIRGFEALVVEALRELQLEKDAQITAQQEEIAALRARLERIEALLAKPADTADGGER